MQVRMQVQVQVQSGARFTAMRGKKRKAHSSLGVLSLSPRRYLWRHGGSRYLHRTLEEILPTETPPSSHLTFSHPGKRHARRQPGKPPLFPKSILSILSSEHLHFFFLLLLLHSFPSHSTPLSTPLLPKSANHRFPLADASPAQPICLACRTRCVMETRIASYLLCEAGRCRDGFALDILFSPSGLPLGVFADLSYLL